MTTKKEIGVYADWQDLNGPVLMGSLTATAAKGKETFSFEYTKDWLDRGFSQVIDPDLSLYSGAYYPKEDLTNFGMFLDSSPDRWGKVLMQRREAAIARMEQRPERKLLESDFLLGVFDGHRMGGLRFKIDPEGHFLNDNKEMASPPWINLRELEYASIKFEEDNRDDPEYLKWVNMLIAPGSSLGGARPKASITGPDNSLWIAKFPGKNDDKDIGLWEMIVNELAVKAGVRVAQGMVKKFNGQYHTYLNRRFDRTETGQRIHFASAMTMLGKRDGDVGQTGYLDLVEFIMKHGSSPDKDMEELWRRMVFNICVKNTDDHLRNHGFLLNRSGWVLSPAYDINPNEYGKELHLNISDTDNSLSLELALEVAGYFRINSTEADTIIKEVQHAVGSWNDLSIKYKISKAERERMAQAFSLAEKKQKQSLSIKEGKAKDLTPKKSIKQKSGRRISH